MTSYRDRARSVLAALASLPGRLLALPRRHCGGLASVAEKTFNTSQKFEKF